MKISELEARYKKMTKGTFALITSSDRMLDEQGNDFRDFIESDN